jgi:hypothetical protein
MKTTQATILDAPLRNTLRRQKLGTRNAHVSVLTIQDNSSIGAEIGDDVFTVN